MSETNGPSADSAEQAVRTSEASAASVATKPAESGGVPKAAPQKTESGHDKP